MKNPLHLILFSCILLHSLALPGQFQHSDSIFATIPYYGEETWPNGNFANGTYSLYSHTAQNLSQVDQALIIVEGWES
ncbi:hypothetical protein [Croceimicrobium hydrocarbonivorans]|uniref:Uncharacterized protein n=1 Tax=Croceimicrobium hydrocarbonivorans TaxID=2761580 RepID=A0A7H0VJ34_9FLAO|nr:hypothetical protein [Croceimicrobium hydrocarbonivorans]QNR25732.1 hypothetical protein H4K34_07790 [Croceimicrobium hydrocarbonivorans]